MSNKQPARWRVEADGLRIMAIVPGYVCVAEAKRTEDAPLLAAAPIGLELASLIVALESSPLQRDYIPQAVQRLAREFMDKAESRS